VGTAYKLAAALAAHFQPAHFSTGQILDLVAIGTVADLVPLLGENRALVRAGLERLRKPHRQGVLSLMGVAGIPPEKLSTTHIGFGLGPRINAAGRLDSAMDAYHLLVSQNPAETGTLAQKLDNQNRERQKITPIGV